MRQSWSHYSFALNNPVRFSDPSGLAADDEWEEEGGGPDPLSFTNWHGSYTSWINSNPYFYEVLRASAVLRYKFLLWRAWGNGYWKGENGNPQSLPGNWETFSMIVDAALMQGVPVELALAVALTESDMGTNKNTWTGKEGDWGIMQINMRWHPEVHEAAKHDPWLNVWFGIEILARKVVRAEQSLPARHHYFNFGMAVYAKYNSGPTRELSEYRSSPRYDLQEQRFHRAWHGVLTSLAGYYSYNILSYQGNFPWGLYRGLLLPTP